MSFSIHSAQPIPQPRRKVPKQQAVVLSELCTTILRPIIEPVSPPPSVSTHIKGDKGDVGEKGDKGDVGEKGENGSSLSVGSTSFLWSNQFIGVGEPSERVVTIPYIASKHLLTSLDLVFINPGAVMIIIKSLRDSKVVAEFIVTSKDDVSTYTPTTFSDLPNTNDALTMSVSKNSDTINEMTLIAATFTM